jgi:hypothetical protein
MLTTERLKELFDYCPSGRLIRRVALRGQGKIGEPTGCARSDGRVFVSADGQKYRAHRLIWLWHGNPLPDRLDHKDRNPQNNRIENLRPCENTENGWNASRSKANKSGVKGVHWLKDNRKWQARIMVNGKNINLGCYGDLELAELVMMEARAKYHGAFAYP